MNAYRVLSETKLLGVDRKFGDQITADEAAGISPAVLHALVSQGILEGSVDIRPPEGWDEQLQHFHARLDQLNETVVECVRILRLLEPAVKSAEPRQETNPAAVQVAPTVEEAPAKRGPGRPRKIKE